MSTARPPVSKPVGTSARARRSIRTSTSAPVGARCGSTPTSGKVTSLQGLELARLQVGVDYRITPDIAIAPVVGGALDMFVSQDSPMTQDYTEIQTKKVSFTGFAGLAGHFDLGGKR